MGRISRRFGAGVAAAGLALALLTPAVALAREPLLLGLNLLPPVGTADSYATPHGTDLVVDPPGVLANDVDLDSPELWANWVSGPSNGTLILEPSGQFHYTPDPGFHGVDKFKYLPFDGDFEALLVVTVSITVAKPLPTPTATPTPRPTPTPTPTPTPILPPPTLPLPTLPLPTIGLPGLPTPTPTPTPTVPAPTPTPTPTPTNGTTGTSPGPGSSSGPSSRPEPSASTAPGAIAVGSSTDGIGPPPPLGGLSLAPAALAGESSSMGPLAFAAFGPMGVGIEWVVPTVLLTVPGFLLLVVGLAQVVGGLIWLPLVRRWLRGDGRPTEAGRSPTLN